MISRSHPTRSDGRRGYDRSCTSATRNRQGSLRTSNTGARILSRSLPCLESISLTPATVPVPAPVATTEHPGNTAHQGVPGLTLCRHRPPGSAPRPAQCHTGQPTRQSVPVRPSKRRGRPPARLRRDRSPPRFFRATPPMVRHSGASEPEATQNAGVPGHHETRTVPTSRCNPWSLGHAIPTAATLKVGPAPPYVRRDGWPHTREPPTIVRARHPLPSRLNRSGCGGGRCKPECPH